MEALQSISELKIRTDKIYYDKKSKVLAIELPGFTFIGNYDKNTRLSLILNDIHKVLEEKGIKIDREDVDFIDASTLMNIHGNTKLKKLTLTAKKEEEAEEVEEKQKIEKKKPEVKKKEVVSKVSSGKKRRKGKADIMVADIEDDATLERMEDVRLTVNVEKEMMKSAKMEEPIIESFEEAEEEEAIEEVKGFAEFEKKESEEYHAPPPAPTEAPASGGGPPSAPGGPPKRAKAASRPMARPPPPQAPGSPPSDARTTSAEDGGAIKSLREEMLTELDGLKDEMKPEAMDDTSSFGAIARPKQYEYNINMGLQYYSVMMEKKSYLFYVYFSHQKLVIADEEGKTVYTTTVKIVTKKKEPPVMDLRIEGEGFEVHPLSGKVEVKKNAVNPPVMIFSIMPTKSNRLKKIKESERRFINVYIDFEGDTISHTVLSVIVQPKHFRMKLGPISFNMNKGTAIVVSIVSIVISVLLLLYSILTIDVTDITGADIVTGFVPQISSFLFVGFFLYTVIQGVYPIKQQFAGLLNFDKDSGITK